MWLNLSLVNFRAPQKHLYYIYYIYIYKEQSSINTDPSGELLWPTYVAVWKNILWINYEIMTLFLNYHKQTFGIYLAVMYPPFDISAISECWHTEVPLTYHHCVHVISSLKDLEKYLKPDEWVEANLTLRTLFGTFGVGGCKCVTAEGHQQQRLTRQH